MGDCFIYNNSAWRLNYCVGGEVTTMFHLDRPMYLLGYLASQSRIYLIDKVRRLRRTPGLLVAHLTHRRGAPPRRDPCSGPLLAPVLAKASPRPCSAAFGGASEAEAEPPAQGLRPVVEAEACAGGVARR